jgi:hypothetical protein
MNNQFKKVDGFETLSPSNIVWRYMGLEKFLDMLERRSLRFARASTMGDRREFRLPYEKVEAKYWQKKRDFDTEDILIPDDTEWELCKSIQVQSDELRRRTYLSSWAIAQTESYALWKIYLGGSRAGVAIKSTFSALQKSIQPNQKHTIQCARVRYTDDPNPAHLKDRHFIYQKSTHYDYEKELRLAIDYNFDPSTHENPIVRIMADSNGDPNPDSLSLKIDTNTLIREVYLSPFVMDGFRDSFEKIVRKIDPDLQAPIRVSAVRDS